MEEQLHPTIIYHYNLIKNKTYFKTMEVHHHSSHNTNKKWKNYLWEFLMLFLAVFAGFLAEYQLEHKIERERADKYLQSMLLDVRTNTIILDSLIQQDNNFIKSHDALLNWLLKDSSSIDRAAFSRTLGAVWIRNFFAHNETYEQMKSSGSLRYVGNIDFLKEMMSYEFTINFAVTRNSEFERKYYTELFIPALYKSFDVTCQLKLDTSNNLDPIKYKKIATHKDILIGNEAKVFRDNMGAALTLRLERLRRSLDAYKEAKAACLKMEKLITSKLDNKNIDK